jgi:6-phosphogluconolactonase
MKLRLDCGSSGILLLCASVCCGGCGEASTSGPPSQMPSAGASGSSAPGGSSNAGAAQGGTPSSGGSGSAGVPGAGAGGTLGASGAAATGGTAGASGSGTAGAAGAGLPLVYVGGTGTDISIYKLDAALGKLTFLKSVAAGTTPSFLAFDPALAHLYAVNEGAAKVASFAVDPKTGDLAFLNRVDSGGDTPAFVSVDHSGKYVMVANYTSGTTRVFPISADGSLGTPSDNKAPGMNSHMILTDAANKFAFVMNLGSDTVVQYAFDASNGTLTPNSAPQVKTATGAGPRHLAFHPNGKYAYLIAELNDTMSAFSYNASLGQLTSIQAPLSTLPAGVDGTTNSCAEVVVAPSGKFVYGSNRGHDSIVTFSIDDATGKLTFVGTTPSGGNVPRSFTLSTDGKLMLVANESGDVASFSVDVTSGALTKLLSVKQTNKPQFVGIVTLPGGTP